MYIRYYVAGIYKLGAIFKQTMEFEYVSDGSFQDILRRDFLELKKCQESKSSKSILILSGSILEALLADYFCENLPTGQTQANILNSTLATLLDLAENSGIIKTKKIKGKLKNGYFELKRNHLLIPIIFTNLYRNRKFRLGLLNNGNLITDYNEISLEKIIEMLKLVVYGMKNQHREQR